MAHAWHLIKRLATSLPATPPEPVDDAWALTQLTSAEQKLWQRLSNPDRRHAILVARRFVERIGDPDVTRPTVAAALLHDVGKLRSELGTWARVAATLIGPHGHRFRDYHDHEAIGVAMLTAADSDPLTIALAGRQPDAPPRLLDALSWADDI